jgi:hypothetical protein
VADVGLSQAIADEEAAAVEPILKLIRHHFVGLV